LTFVTDDVWDAVLFAEHARHGAFPVTGGTLDQAKVFLEACRFIWNEEATHRAGWLKLGED